MLCRIIYSLIRHTFIDNINTARFSQRVVSKILATDGFIEKHLTDLNNVYRNKRNLMYQMLIEHFPKSSIINLPRSGLFFWVSLPSEINLAKLLHLAIKQYKVAFIAGDSFLLEKNEAPQGNFIRLNFSFPSLENISSGIKSLAEAINHLSAKAMSIAV